MLSKTRCSILIAYQPINFYMRAGNMINCKVVISFLPKYLEIIDLLVIIDNASTDSILFSI